MNPISLLLMKRTEIMTFKAEEIVDTRRRLRELLEEPDSGVTDKDLDHLNEVARKFVAMSPFLLLSTKGSDGRMDVSPKGDPGGFVEVFDNKTLIIPDRLGNQRVDTFENLLVDPSIGLLFLIPGHTETLRVSGTAKIVQDSSVQERHAVNGKKPLLALVVTVEQVFMHCSKCLVRSRLWQTEHWPTRRSAPTLAEWVHSVNLPQHSVEQLQSCHDKDATQRLY
jgi:uncharacterized protein